MEERSDGHGESDKEIHLERKESISAEIATLIRTVLHLYRDIMSELSCCRPSSDKELEINHINK